MALPTEVNGQITDAVTQSNVSVLGQAPAMAMGTIYQAQANAMAILFANMTGGRIVADETPAAVAATPRTPRVAAE